MTENLNAARVRLRHLIDKEENGPPYSEQLNKEIESFKKKISENQNKQVALQKRIASAQNEIESRRKFLDDETKPKSQDAIDKLESDIRDYQGQIREDKSRIEYFESLIFSFKHSIREHQESLTNAHGSLSKHEAGELFERIEAHGPLNADTHKQIEFQKRRLAFIQAHPEYFITPHKDAHDLIGLDLIRTMNDLIAPPAHVGQDVLVGVMDNFTRSRQSSSIMRKVINPEFVGMGMSQGVDRKEDTSHGIHVAGIIASDDHFSNRTIGVAPGSQIELMTTESIGDFKSRGHLLLAIGEKKEAPWDVSKTVEFIDALDQLEKARLSGDQNKVREAEIHLSLLRADFRDEDFEILNRSQLSNSNARMINVSLGFSSLTRFERRSELDPEIKPYVLAGLKRAIDQGKLFVIALWNDDVSLGSTPQHRTLKALAQSPHTKHGFIGVINLGTDGLTISGSSNQPGTHEGLQVRSISAPGTEITSTVRDTEGKDTQVLGTFSGTSMAAPHVSGAAAIVLSNYPNLTQAQLSQAILEGATPILLDDHGFPYEVKDLAAGELERSGRFTHEQISRARAKYGMGRLNVPGALKRARKIMEWDARGNF